MESPVTLIANPAAKRASEKKLELAVKLLHATGREVDVFLTRKRGDAEELARSASMQGTPLVIAAGGDGTFNEVINGIAKTETKMAILPLGTTNVLAKELGIPEDVKGAVNRALTGDVHSASLGCITLVSHESRVTRYFCLMAGIGFDGEAVYGISGTAKKYSGKGAYILSGLKALMRYAPEEMTFIVNGNGETYSGYSAIIGKASKYGGHFKITPDACLVNPDLYIFIMHGKRRTDVLRYASGILMGSHLQLKGTSYRKAESVEIKGNAHIQIDGDYLGRTPARITVVPDALKLIY